jgi:hypothetical protein
MTKYFSLLLAAFLLIGCKKDVEAPQDTITESPQKTTALQFEPAVYEKATTLPCKDEICTTVSINIPKAINGNKIVADSINKNIFNTVRSIVYFGEKPTNATTYENLMASFIKSYEDLVKKYPEEAMPWDATINATVEYTSDRLINVRLNHYTFTGGAHGYEGDRSLLFDAKTGKSIKIPELFKDVKAFTAFAEKKFRAKYKIPDGKPINSTGLTFENERFQLPQNIFFTKEGIILYYNSYEIASYAEQQKEVRIPYNEIDKYLTIK